jgi:Bacterial Ig-like domain (group 3)/NHL repeat
MKSSALLAFLLGLSLSAVPQACGHAQIATHSARATSTQAGQDAFSPAEGRIAHTGTAETFTTLTGGLANLVEGQTLAIVAVVTGPGGTPTGSVTFTTSAGLTLGTAELSPDADGSSSTAIATSALPVGGYYVTATYSGDMTFAPSTGVDSGQVDAPPPVEFVTAVQLTASANSVIARQPVTFTATVTSAGPTPTGYAVFIGNNLTMLGSAPLVSGTGSFTTSSLPADTNYIQAIYYEDLTHTSAGSAAYMEFVTPESTATTLLPSANPSLFGQAVTFSANVVGQDGSTPSGTVSFYDGGILLGTNNLVSGVATYSTAGLARGAHTITASFAGGGWYASSNSAPVSEDIASYSTATALGSSVNPSAAGQSVTFTATVSSSGGTPTGSVAFTDGSTTIGTGTLSGGMTTLTLSTLAAGAHSIVATYGGDVSYLGSASAPVKQTVLQTAAVALASSANPSTYGQSVTFTATVTGSGVTPTGTVSFNDGSTTLKSATLASGTATFTTSALTAGGHSITGVYSGDSVFASSPSSALAQTVNRASTSVNLSAFPVPANLGQPITLYAAITSLTASVSGSAGTVTFMDGTNSLGTAALSGGFASLPNVILPNAGPHFLSAVYGGDTNFNGNTSPAVIQTVNLGTSSTTLTPSMNPSASGQSVTFTVTVTGSGGTPTGGVLFNDGTTLIGTGALASGRTTFTIASLQTGKHTITAAYGGDTNFSGSNSAPLVQTVNPGTATLPTTTSLQSSIGSITFGQLVTFTASVGSPGEAPGNLPTGSVAFQDGTTTIGTGMVNSGGVATFTTSSLGAGARSITALYSGDSVFLASTSAAVTQTVNRGATSTVLTASPNPSANGQPVTLSATVSGSGGVPTGTATFMDGSTSLGVSTLSASGVAAFTTASLAPGGHALTAIYGSDPNFLASTSSSVTETVNMAASTATATALAAAPNPSVAGQSVSFSAAVTGSGGIPTGSVSFSDGGSLLGTVSLAGGSAGFSTGSLAIGQHTIVAAYGGDGTFAASSSAAVTEIVDVAPSAGQSYQYQSTLGATGNPGSDNAHFDNPVAGGVDTANGHFFVADTTNHRVQVFDTTSLAVVATIGVSGIHGGDNTHLNLPGNVAVDPASGRIFVADTGNHRVQVFDAASFAYVATLGATGTPGSDNGHFDRPASVGLNPAGQLYVTDAGNQRVQIFGTPGLAYVGTLGATGVPGADNAHFDQPADAQLDPTTDQILVADTGNARVQIFDAGSFSYVATLGVTGAVGSDSGHFAAPGNIAFDSLSNLVLVTDGGGNARVQVFDAMTYAYVETLGSTASSGSGNGQFAAPQGVAIDRLHARAFVGDGRNDRVQVFAVAPVTTVAATLPGSRSVQLGSPATIFASVINSGTATLNNCRVALPVTAPAGLTLTYQTTDPATNALTGTPNAPAMIAGNDGLQTFLVSLQGTDSFSAPGLALDFGCTGAAPAAVVPGVDMVDLVMSSTPIADIIALAATPTNNGVVELPVGGAGAFAVASTNVGASAPITVSVDTGSATLPVALTLCQSKPSTGQCLAPPAATVSLSYAAGTAPTFSVFLQSSGAIAFAPAASRIYVRFKDANGGLHGSTSVAIETM